MLPRHVNRILCSTAWIGYPTKMQVDWNPVVHILDKLSEGTHSFLELGYMVPSYDRKAFTDALLFLSDRGLIDLSAGTGPFTPIPKSEWTQRLVDGFSTEGAEQPSMTDNVVDLTQDGEHVLRLFGIGHP